MKTLVFNGSPREKGNTVFLINKLTEKLLGEVLVVNAYNSSIKPCNDCRFCFENVGCSINDEMQGIYEYIKECDNIVIASPIYFSELSGSLLNLLSRLQMFYGNKKFLKIEQIKKKKKGAVILCGGGSGGYEKAEDTAKTILKLLKCEHICTVCSLNTDEIESFRDISAIDKINELALLLNN